MHKISQYHVTKVIAFICLALCLASCQKKVVIQEASQKKTTASIPDLRHIDDVSSKKRLFFAALRPLVIAENNRILQQRQSLIKLKTKTSLTADEQQLRTQLVQSYRLNTAGQQSFPWKSLLNRVNTVPLALVLSQAANESAWGTSRFARQANNLFGQWCFRKGCGLVPKHRSAGSSHEVASFASPQESVRSYLHNLNSNPVYTKLRHIRAQHANSDTKATASQLAEGLSQYSERGIAYVKEIQAMIRHNAKYMQGSN